MEVIQMNELNFDKVNQFVNENIVAFHNNRLSALNRLTLSRLLAKNPYLFKAKYLETASELINSLLEAFLSSSEEKIFGDFLEDLAIFIAQQTSNGKKSSAAGIDLEFERGNIHYLVSIKSGTNWGNSSQHRRLADDFISARRVLQQSQFGMNVQPVLGICYGKTKTSITNAGYLKVVGQNFWYLISGNKNLYVDIIEPVGYRAKEHNQDFNQQRNKIANRFTGEFITTYCYPDGGIHWEKLVTDHCGNFDMPTMT
jgi:hypothetical protein